MKNKMKILYWTAASLFIRNEWSVILLNLIFIYSNVENAASNAKIRR